MLLEYHRYLYAWLYLLYVCSMLFVYRQIQQYIYIAIYIILSHRPYIQYINIYTNPLPHLSTHTPIYMYSHTDQIYQKRDRFRKQIRNRHKQQLFHKMRVKVLQQSKQSQNNVQLIQQLIHKLPYMYQISKSISLIADHGEQILRYIGDVRRYEECQDIFKCNVSSANGSGMGIGKRDMGQSQYGMQCITRLNSNNTYQTNTIYIKQSSSQQSIHNPNHNHNHNHNYNQQQAILTPILQYLSTLISTIYSNFTMDIQSGQYNQQIYQQIQSKFGQIFHPISCFLINMLSTQTQYIPLSYLHIILKITYYNIFLCRNLTLQLKLSYINQYLHTLKSNPILYLNNCHLFTKILLYCLQLQPYIYQQQYRYIHQQIIHQLEKIYSILSYSSKLSIENKNQYREYSYIILHKLSENNCSNCWMILNSTYIMPQLEKVLGELHGMFCSKREIDEEYRIVYVVEAMKLLQNLGYYDHVIMCMNQLYPRIWVYLLGVFTRISVEYWVQGKNDQYKQKDINRDKGNEGQGRYYDHKNKYSNKNRNMMMDMDMDDRNTQSIQQQLKNIKKSLPPIFMHPYFPQILQKILKCMTNFICIYQLCQSFITHQFSPNHNKNNTNNIDNIDSNNNIDYHTQQHPSTSSSSSPSQCIQIQIQRTWIEILTQIYNNNYKTQRNRLECLYIFKNVLTIVGRNWRELSNCAKLKRGCNNKNNSNNNDNEIENDRQLQDSEQLYQQQYRYRHKNNNKTYHTNINNTHSHTNTNNPNNQQTPSLLSQLLTQSTDLIIQTLKLSNKNNKLIIQILSTLRAIIQQSTNNNDYQIINCQLFHNNIFMNRLTTIAEKIEEDDKQNRRVEYYGEDVRIQAMYLLEALRISY